MSNENEEGSSNQVSEMFALSPWYSDIIYVLQNLSRPPSMTRNKARTLKLKAAKFFILNSALYWKDLGGVILNCLVEEKQRRSWRISTKEIVVVTFFGKQQQIKF